MIRRVLFICLLGSALAATGSAYAAGSLFSGLGYGIIEDFTTSRGIGMGNAGLALRDSTALNFANPALLADLRRVHLSVGGYAARQWIKDTQASDVDDWAQVEFFGLGIPLARGLAVGLTMSPYSRVDFEYAWEDDLPNLPTSFQTYQGSGGLTRAALQAAWAPGSWGQIGVAGSAIWGEVEEVRGSYISEPGYQDLEFVTSKQWLAFSGRVGLLLTPSPKLNIAATYEPEVPVDLNQEYSISNQDTLVTSEAEFRLAARYGLGASWQVSPQWLTAAQVFYGAWDGISDLPVNSANYQNSLELAVGAEWAPGAPDADRFMNRLSYRFGARRESSYLLADGDPVEAYFGTAGISYPFHGGRDRLDLSLELGRRGSLSANTAEETVLRFRLGLNLGETWFQRTKPDWQK
ncbi:MAG: hypothetical protein C4524_03885 [Candidatus Zixiibacteriota bacterium]|nr:MAG: hypothetical protein C4524_03885 [candidate division Zixibacteria bacterium]